MADLEGQGFVVRATVARLEDWWLEHFCTPSGGGLPQWPGGRTDAIRPLLLEHWGLHGVAVLEPTARCLETPCRALGVALASLEIAAYEAACAELRELPSLRQAQGNTSISSWARAQLLARADQIATSPVSRAAMNRTEGRPRLILAEAIAQHLWMGGFSHSEVAAFMGSTVKAASDRCKVGDMRSLAALLPESPKRLKRARRGA